MVESSGASRAKLALFEYDFTVDGGAAGAIIINPDGLPENAIIWDGMVLVHTAVVGTTSTLAISVVGANDLLTATAEASLTVGTMHDIVPDGTASNALKVGASKIGVTFTIGTNDLTAGRVMVALRYFDLY
jgi:hypothetical protein